MKPCARRLLVAILILIPSQGLGWAAEYYGDCVETTPMNQGWNLPADGVNHPLLMNKVTAESMSDVVLTAAVTLERTSTPGTRVVYVWEVDGVQRAPWMMRRIPQQLPASQTFQTVVPSVSAGVHEFRLLARHLESPAQLVRYGVMLMTPQFVDDLGNETVFLDSDPAETVDFGATWTTLKSLSIAVESDEMLEVGASFRVSAGSPGNPLEYRLRVGGDVAFTWTEDTPTLLPDGVHLSRFVQGPRSGVQVVEIQARSPSGVSTQARNRYLFAQTMPQYHLLEATACDAPDIPADGAYHALLSTPFSLISEISRGDQIGSHYRSFVGGEAFIGVPAQSARTHRYRLQMVIEDGPPLDFDLGQRLGRSSASSDLFSNVLSGGCGGCGWSGDSRHRAELWAQSTCATPGAQLAFSCASFQLIMVPSRWFFPSTGCTGYYECCEVAANCTYECEPSHELTGGLSLVNVGPLACP